MEDRETYDDELAYLRDENARLKAENARLLDRIAEFEKARDRTDTSTESAMRRVGFYEDDPRN